MIPLLDQQPGVFAQAGLSEQRKFPAQFFAEQEKAQFSPVQLLSGLLLHGVSGFPVEGSVAPRSQTMTSPAP